MKGSFAIPRARRKGFRSKAPAANPEQRVNSYTFNGGELAHAVRDGAFECYGSAVRSTSQPGDLARSFFGAVLR